MDRSRFNELRDELFKEIAEISDRKGNDYSGNEDVVKSFKSNSAQNGLTPVQVWSVLILKHWDAIMTYVRTGKLESEGIRGRVTDVILYLVLFLALIDDEENASIAEEVKQAIAGAASPSTDNWTDKL